jgi:hypothetical protein
VTNAPVRLDKAAPDDQTSPAYRPRTVTYAVVALGISALGALAAALSLYGASSWLLAERIKADIKAKRFETTAQYHHAVSQQQRGGLIMTCILVAVIAVLAISAYRGRYWARWATVALWLLATFSQMSVGIGGLFAPGTHAPVTFKVAAFVASAGFIVALIYVNMRPSTAYFALNKPARPTSTSTPARRGGLFAPRPAPAPNRASSAGAAKAKSVLTSTAASRGEAYVQKQRAKKRAVANAESVARGAELARNRAKASKSRRIET